MGLSKKDRYVYCADCGCRLEMNGICKICGHADNPLLPGIVPDVTGLSSQAADTLFTDPEAQLVLGEVSTEYSEIVDADRIITTDPVAGTQLKKGDSVNIVISLGSAA